jgi:two-component system phosphate regulon sensor histidine kinase PhoR
MADELDRLVETLAGERDRLETILEGMDDAVLAFDAKQRITLVNAAAHDLLGLGEQPLGKTLLETVRTPALADLVDAAVSGRAGSTDVEIAGPRGKKVLAWASPLRATKGVVVVLHDVTEIRRLEAVRSDFVANVSHELRTPITVIRANVETLLDGAIDDPTHARAFASGILRNAERLSHLVSDLLDLSRIESRQWTLARDTIDLRTAALGAATALESQARDRDVDLSVDIDDGLSVVGDEKALDGVLVNLLDNAVKYTPCGGHVQVSARAAGERIRIEVRDDGPGIEARHRERIFERFYRVDKGRSRQLGGTGLGLAIVKHLVEAMHGDVGVEPAHPRGSVFWVELPTSPPSERGEDAR